MRLGWPARVRSWFVRDDVSEDEAEDAEGAGIWDATPSWQYNGLHVESGGLARDEQEAALGDVERQAREREDR